MAKRATTKQQQTHSWAVYHTEGTAAKLVAIVDAPDAVAAIALAIEVENVPPNERGRLMARGRRIKGTPAKLVAIVDAPDAVAAIALAIEVENVPPNERGRLIAHRLRE